MNFSNNKLYEAERDKWNHRVEQPTLCMLKVFAYTFFNSPHQY